MATHYSSESIIPIDANRNFGTIILNIDGCDCWIRNHGYFYDISKNERVSDILNISNLTYSGGNGYLCDKLFCSAGIPKIFTIKYNLESKTIIWSCDNDTTYENVIKTQFFYDNLSPSNIQFRFTRNDGGGCFYFYLDLKKIDSHVLFYNDKHNLISGNTYSTQELDLSSMESMNQVIDGVTYTLDVDDIYISDSYSSKNKDSSSANISCLPWLAFSKSTSNKWHTNNTPFPHYIELSYSKPMIITRISLIASDDCIVYLIKNFNVQLYTENNKYITVYEGSHPNSIDEVTYTLNQRLLSTKIKITITSTYDSRGYRWAGIRYIGLYAYKEILS